MAVLSWCMECLDWVIFLKCIVFEARLIGIVGSMRV